MQNIRLTIQYDGTRYLGWQRPEKDGLTRSVSYKISEVLNRMTGEEIALQAGARTDPGVHVLAQTVSFQTDAAFTPEEILRGLNRYLPQDIAVLSAENAPERFRADLKAVSRTYECHICTSKIYNVFTAGRETHWYPAPDLSLMESAAALLKGRHDFRPFSSGRKKKGTQKTLLDLTFLQEQEHIVMQITADDFLHQMPALIAGTLLEAGAGKRSPESIAAVFDGTEKAGSPAEAKSLLLKSIQYSCRRNLPRRFTSLPASIPH